MEIFFNILGVLGIMLLLFGFYRVNIGKWNNKSFWYEFDNFLGAILIISYQLYYHAYVTVVANFIWGAIAFLGIVVFLRRVHIHKHKKSKRR